MKLIIDTEKKVVKGYCKAKEFKKQIEELKKVINDGRY